jgi:hypothetical protein
MKERHIYLIIHPDHCCEGEIVIVKEYSKPFRKGVYWCYNNEIACLCSLEDVFEIGKL